MVAWVTSSPLPFSSTIRSTRWQAPINQIGPPSAPTGLQGLADGSTVTLSWLNTYSGGAPASIVLDVSGAHVGSFPRPLSERFTLPGVPPGTYSVAVRAVNAFGSSGPSNAVTLTFPGCPSPEMPTNVFVTRLIDLPPECSPWDDPIDGCYPRYIISASWRPPASGAAPTDYLVDVTGSFVGTFSTAALGISGEANFGRYTVSVRARNACGVSAATPAQTMTIP